MTHDQIDNAVDEAKRFIERAQLARDAMEFQRFGNAQGGYWNVTDTRATAALKRASMDLTRALVAIRKVGP